jgi:deoxyribodipyrimidine photo-lyase
MNKKVSIFWFRRDLRLKDNVGLMYALKGEFPVLSIFIFDTTILDKLKDKRDQRVTFIYKALEKIKVELNDLGSDLQVYHGNPEYIWKELLNKYDVQVVYANEDYEPNAIKRDKKIEKLLSQHQRHLHLYKDQCIFAKDDVLKNDGTPYTVYTPYKNKWREKLTPKDIASVKTLKYKDNFLSLKKEKMLTLADIGFKETQVLNKKTSINKDIITLYDKQRDLPYIEGTSLMGVHLRFGTVSVRRCAQIGLELNQTWLDELIWREFFMQILYHFPHVVTKSFKEKYEKIKWLNNNDQFKMWCEGKTGYPLVDAGMRELNATGHMHNRVRMLTASFLVKHLLIDWRWGEKYFASKLMDYDQSANNGNWQWAAGTGCDAAPYFRIFNPYTQQKKFDPEFVYIKKWVPEYGTDDYPHEIVEHKMGRDRALMTYKQGLANEK